MGLSSSPSGSTFNPAVPGAIGGTTPAAATFTTVAATAVAARAMEPSVAFSTMTLLNSWSNFGSGYEVAKFRKIHGQVEVTGVVTGGSATAGSAFYVLPIPCRPALRKIIPSWFQGGATPRGFLSDGSIVNDSASSNFQSLDGQFGVEGTFATFFGDSITLGTGASDDAHKWTTLLCAAKSWTQDNQGISGTVLQNSDALTNNGYDTRLARVASHYADYVFILYGINDVDHDGTDSSTTYQTQLTTIINDIIARGVPAQRIYLGTLPYVDPVKQISGSGAFADPFDAGTTIKLLDYNTKITAIAAATKVNLVDIYTAMANGGGNSLLGSDGIHPNDTGHALIYSTFSAAVTAVNF